MNAWKDLDIAYQKITISDTQMEDKEDEEIAESEGIIEKANEVVEKDDVMIEKEGVVTEKEQESIKHLEFKFNSLLVHDSLEEEEEEEEKEEKEVDNIEN